MREFDIRNFDKYRENNRLEVKKARGGLPESIWETYSSMANCYGGIILLGVIDEQYNPDRTILTLVFTEKQAEKTGVNSRALKTVENKKLILDFLHSQGSSKATDIAMYIGLSSARARVILSELADDGKVQTEGNGRSRRYMLSDAEII